MSTHPEDTRDFALAEIARMKDTAADPLRVIAELKAIRERLAAIETQIRITSPDERVWAQAEDISRQISRLDRLTDAMEGKPRHQEEPEA